MNNYRVRFVLSMLLCGVTVNSWCSENPVLLVTPIAKVTSPLVSGQLGTAIYQVMNNSNRTLSNIQLDLPKGITQVSNSGTNYCTSLSSLNTAGSVCLIEVRVDSSMSGNVSGGPVISAMNGVYRSQPWSFDQLSTRVTSGPISQTCAGNISNFTYELTQTIDSSTIDPATINSWGPGRNQLLLSASNPNLTTCPTTDTTNTTQISWMQDRIIEAEKYWVNQKLNYCHHHVTDFYTPLTSNGTPRTSIGSSDGGYCSNATSLAPSNYGQQIRWNYTGTGSETVDMWVNKNRMWYGVDCSDFTSFAYNFSFGIQFNSDTGYQAGQAIGHSQDALLPNTQTTSSILRIPTYTTPTDDPAGLLVCADGTVETRSGLSTDYCGGGASGPHTATNNYFSVFLASNQPPISDSNYPKPTPSNITPSMLNLLKPGDLLYLAFSPASGKHGDGNNSSSVVTHVITWTGKKVGYGANDVNPSQIAPESICPDSWQPQIGDWVIIDSHYQGPDYRDFTACFYQNNIWGVRRVIGYQHS